MQSVQLYSVTAEEGSRGQNISFIDLYATEIAHYPIDVHSATWQWVSATLTYNVLLSRANPYPVLLVLHKVRRVEEGRG